jgi:anti-sigma B factor antagonist
MERSALVSVSVEAVPELSAAIIRVRGELDFGSSPRLSQALAQLPAGSSLLFDLSELRFCDSSGLGVLISAYKTANAAGAKVYLAGLTPTVLTAIKVTMLDELFSLHETAEAALAEMSAA